ncbi:minor capsid protein [Longispora albida]|uniref:minor capsid protein n=1 Tax=Longispora albida TaxID=203523 RepID=UPI00036661BB|nr:minor capsid protein [Longispora albida]
MGLADGLARYLATAGLVTYSATSASGNVFLDDLPPAPDLAVAVALYAGPESDTGLGYDEPSVQVTVRGPASTQAAADLAAAVYDALHGLGPLRLPGGTHLLSCAGVQSGPVPLGLDESGRRRFAVNFRTEIRAASAHRT